MSNIYQIIHKLFSWGSSSRFTKEEALNIAAKYGLRTEILEAMRHGCSPDEALEDWDIYPM